jgi:hypothetical protein
MMMMMMGIYGDDVESRFFRSLSISLQKVELGVRKYCIYSQIDPNSTFKLGTW